MILLDSIFSFNGEYASSFLEEDMRGKSSFSVVFEIKEKF